MKSWKTSLVGIALGIAKGYETYTVTHTKMGYIHAGLYVIFGLLSKDFDVQTFRY